MRSASGAACGSALDLAVFRIAVALVFLTAGDVWEASRWAALAPDLRAVPAGSRWLFAIAPTSPDVVKAGTVALAVALVLSAIGLYARAALAIASILGLWILAIPQAAGFVFHVHHLVWFTALLAASPSGDALSIDAYRRAHRIEAPPDSVAYGLPLRAAQLLIAVIFFFPGWWKLRESGLEWIFSDNLRNQLYTKWIQFEGFEPLFRIDRHPWMLRSGALFTVAFELAFPLLILFRRTRAIAAVAALLFHAGTRAFMGIDFSVLYCCYVVFFDFRSVLARWIPASEAPLQRSARPVAIMAALLLTGAITAGALGITSGWPFACYPTFQWLATKLELPVLMIELVRADGATVELQIERGSQRRWAQQLSLAGALDRPPSLERLRAFWIEVKRDQRVEGAASVRFYRAYVSTVPEDHQRVLRRVLLGEVEG